jgi:hypothetical protein
VKTRDIIKRAEEYARLLTEGSEILDDVDAPVVRDFIQFLPGMLQRRELYLARGPRGLVVTRTPPWLQRRLLDVKATPPPVVSPPVQVCLLCGDSWWQCACAPGSFLLIPWADAGDFAPMLPRFPVRASA